MKKLLSVFVAAFAAVNSACVNDITMAAGTGSAEAGPDANPCPADKPALGVACSAVGLVCHDQICCGAKWAAPVDVLKDQTACKPVPDAGKPELDAGADAVAETTPADSGGDVAVETAVADSAMDTFADADAAETVPPATTVKVVVTIKAGAVGGKPADHVYVNGMLVAESDLRPDGSVVAYKSWGSLGCDAVKSTADLVCTVFVPTGMDLRFQGFVRRGSQVLNTCGDPVALDGATTQSVAVNGLGEVTPALVTNLTGDGRNCQAGRKSAKK